MRTNKFRLVIFLVILLLIYPLTLLRAESHIKNIILQREGDYTNVTILAESPFQINHFIEERKDGKPYRIVIDCLNSVHALQQNNFMKLPSGTISAIRTSQYQTSPEKICRVVIDLKDPVIYKVVEKEDKKIATLALSTPQDPVYPEWSAVQENANIKTADLAETKQVANVSTNEKSNKSIALKDESNKLPKKELASTVTPEKKISSSTETKTAVAQKTDLKEKAQSQVKKETQVNPPAPVKEIREKQTPPAGEDKQIKLAQTETTPSEKTAPPQVKKEEQKSKAPEKTEAEKSEKPAVAKTEAQVEKPEAKIAGKKVEEVPQRKLLVYHSGEREDPFSPLTGKKSFTLGGTAPLPNIEELKLVGILESNNGFKALLENELGFGYILQAGDKIRNGAVVSIEKERIIFQISEYGFTKNIALELFTPNQEER